MSYGILLRNSAIMCSYENPIDIHIWNMEFLWYRRTEHPIQQEKIPFSSRFTSCSFLGKHSVIITCKCLFPICQRFVILFFYVFVCVYSCRALTFHPQITDVMTRKMRIWDGGSIITTITTITTVTKTLCSQKHQLTRKEISRSRWGFFFVIGGSSFFRNV